MSSTLHVIFGTGPVGQSVMHELRTRPDTHVRMINRSGRRGDIPAEVEVRAADAYDEAQVREVTEGAAVVYQCAQPEYTEWPQRFPPLQTAILNGTAASGAKLIVADNLYMYPDTHGAPIHEGLPYTPHTRKGQVRAAMARQILDAHERGQVRAALVRASDFYGPGAAEQSVLGERAILPLMQGKSAQFLFSVDEPHSYTYIGDFGRALVIAGEREAALGAAWHVPNAPAMTTREIMQIAAQQLGVELKISVIPGVMVRGLSLFMPILREMSEMAYEFNQPYIVDHSKFEAAFGNIATPIEAGIRDTIAWFQTHEATAAHA